MGMQCISTDANIPVIAFSLILAGLLCQVGFVVYKDYRPKLPSICAMYKEYKLNPHPQGVLAQVEIK